MVEVMPIAVGGHTAVGVKVELPKTRFIAIATPRGYIACGALDVALLDEKLGDRRVIAGRALGVRSFGDLLERPLERVTLEAEALGIRPGMPGKEALARMF